MFMEVLKSVTTLAGRVLPSLGGKFIFDGVSPPWILAGIPKKGLSPPIEDKAQT